MYKLIVVLLLISSAIFANDVEKRRSQIIGIINEEIREVETLLRRSGGSNPDLLLRMGELTLEKARLYREKENQDYLKISPKKRSKVNKTQFFSVSSGHFSKANSLCLEITRKHPRYKRLGEVYYILGYNLKESGNSKKAGKYLANSTKYSKSKKLKAKSQLTLADIKFNEKKFKTAKNLYEKSLKIYIDKWWTKDSFNLAWSYYHLGMYPKAISKMKEVYKNSKKSQFVDMSDQVERDLGVFYATSGQVDEGIKFYRSIGVDFSKRLFSIAKTLKKSGKFKSSIKVLNTIINTSSSHDEKVEANLMLLEIYDKSSRFADHAKIVERLYSLNKGKKLVVGQKRTFQFQVEKVAAFLQRQVLSKTYRRLKKQRKAKANQAIRYFEILAEFDRKRYDEFSYLKAETAYAVGDYLIAYKSYLRTFDYSVKAKRNKFKSKSMNNMLVTISKFKKRYDLNVETFERYVSNFPKGKKLKSIYVRLFNNYFAMNDLKKAKWTLDRYKTRYPRAKDQEVMIAKLMDINRKNGDNEAIRIWVAKIDQGEYFVSAKYKRKLQETLTTLQMEDVQSNLKKGKKASALNGYLKVLEDPYSTKRSKVNAKYNLAVLYYELGDVNNSYKWSIASLNEMSAKDAKRFLPSFIAISSFLFMSLDYKKSAAVSERMLRKICRLKSKNKNTVFKNAGFINLAQNSISGAERIVALGRACNIPSRLVSELEYEILKESFYTKDYNRFEQYAMKVDKYSSYQGKMVDEYLKLNAIYKKLNNPTKEARYYSLAKKRFEQARSSKKLVSLKSIDFFAKEELKNLKKTSLKLERIKLSYPEKVFEKQIRSSLALLDKLVVQANTVIQLGSGDGIISTYDLLERSYKAFAKKINSFTPPGKNAEYIKGFRSQFLAMSNQMNSAAKKYRDEALIAIKNNEILSNKNNLFQENPLPIRFFGNGVIMDRGGVR